MRLRTHQHTSVERRQCLEQSADLSWRDRTQQLEIDLEQGFAVLQGADYVIEEAYRTPTSAVLDAADGGTS
jgi:hypothetical protein